MNTGLNVYANRLIVSAMRRPRAGRIASPTKSPLYSLRASELSSLHVFSHTSAHSTRLLAHLHKSTETARLRVSDDRKLNSWKKSLAETRGCGWCLLCKFVRNSTCVCGITLIYRFGVAQPGSYLSRSLLFFNKSSREFSSRERVYIIQLKNLSSCEWTLISPLVGPPFPRTSAENRISDA